METEILKVTHLNKFYGARQVLFDVNFTLHQGEVLTLLGPSGSGKSTLLRTLNGLEAFQAGTLTFNGQPVVADEAHWQKLRQKIGMVFQSYDLFPNLTVLENITLAPVKIQGRSAATVQAEALALLERVGLSAYAKAYPRELSGGQKQRIAIVRALALHPELMLFDEVTASLDPEMVRGVLEIIKQLSQEAAMTMIIVTHEMNFAAQIADRVLFLADGKIVEDTPGQQFFAQPQTQRAKLLLRGVGKLDAVSVLHALAVQFRIPQRIERQRTGQCGVILLKKVVYPIVHSGQKNAAGFEHAEALAPDGCDLLHIAIGNRVKDTVKALFCKRKRLCHICLYDFDRVAFPLRHRFLTLQLEGGIVKYGAGCSQKGKDRHLLASSGSESQKTAPGKRWEPVMWDRFYRGEKNIPFSLPHTAAHLMGDWLPPLPAILHPLINGFRISFCIILHHFSFLYIRNPPHGKQIPDSIPSLHFLLRLLSVRPPDNPMNKTGSHRTPPYAPS